MKNGNRSTDGITINKIAVSMVAATATICLSLITWVYTSDRKEFKQDIKSIAENTQKISTQQKVSQAVSYSHRKNTDVRLTIVEKNQTNFIARSEIYWSRNGAK